MGLIITNFKVNKKITQLDNWKARIKNFLRGDFLRSKELSAFMQMSLSLAKRQGASKICFIGKTDDVVKKRFGADFSFLQRFKKFFFSVNDVVKKNDLVVVYCKDMSVGEINKKMREFYDVVDCIICIGENSVQAQEICNNLQKNSIKELFSGKGEDSEYLLIYDKEVISNIKVVNEVGSQLRIQAIVTCYNEEDIIGHTIEYLIKQGIYVHVIDNWSIDQSSNIIKKYVDISKFVTSEQFPVSGPSKTYDWEKILTKVQNHAMKKASEFDWFVHHDADEVRESPFEQIKGLRKGIEVVDKSGFNAIDHTVINFGLVKDGFDGSQDLEKWFKYFSFGEKKDFHHKQVKAWKSSGRVNLASSGGHIAEFDKQRIFPYRFLLKHYPLRSLKQASQKIFRDRKKRFNEEERKKNWHVQYDAIISEDDLLVDVSKLIKYDREKIFRKYIKPTIFCISED